MNSPRTIAAAAAVFGLVGCTPRTPTYGMLDMDGAHIEAADHSFEITAHQSFARPFAVDCPALPLTPEHFREGARLGAAQVLVKVPGVPAPLFGLLSFCRLPSDATGPGSRRYRIDIPPEYVAATDGGRISVVFEEVAVGSGSRAGWILWLSRAGFQVEK